jgi:FAD:protein FMN transferase
MTESADQPPCTGPPDGGSERDARVGIGAPAGLSGLHRFSHEAMATIFEVLTLHPDRRYAAQAAHAAFDVLDELERELSRFIPNSDIARINNVRAGQETRVSPTTLECLTIARHVFDLTAGAFDISLGTGLPSLEFHDDGCVRAAKDGVQLDLGAIGKGYAVDCMAEVLEEWGLGSALVHGGFSSVLALEPPHGHAGWPLTISDPMEPSRVLRRLAVRQTALGASGLQKGDHIRDPRTGEPVRGRIAAWATVQRPPGADATHHADTPRIAAAAVADALTTAFMLLEHDEIQSLCDGNPGLEAWVLPGVDGNGRVLRHFEGPHG